MATLLRAGPPHILINTHLVYQMKVFLCLMKNDHVFYTESIIVINMEEGKKNYYVRAWNNISRGHKNDNEFHSLSQSLNEEGFDLMPKWLPYWRVCIYYLPLHEMAGKCKSFLVNDHQFFRVPIRKLLARFSYLVRTNLISASCRVLNDKNGIFKTCRTSTLRRYKVKFLDK